MFSNRVYDVLKWIAQIFIPALGTLYFALATIWNWPYVEAILGTLTALDTFFGALLGISTAVYNKATAPAEGEDEDMSGGVE